MIDADMAVELLERVVKGREDFIYNPHGNTVECWYVRDGECSCVVGRALGLVFPIETVAKLDGVIDTVTKGPQPCTAIGIHRYLEGITEQACLVLARAQEMQDTGGTWGAALQAAKDYANWLKQRSL